MEGLATALGNFVEEAQGLSAQFDPQVVFYIGTWGVTQYIVWLFIALAVTSCSLPLRRFRWFPPTNS